MTYLPAIAIIVSLVSLFFTLRNNRFNGRFKIVEAKTSILFALSDLSLHHAQNIALHQEIKSKATKHGHDNILKILDELEERLVYIRGNMERMYELANALREKDVLAGYEHVYPEIKRMRNSSTELFDFFNGVSTKYAQFLAPKA